MSKNKLEFSNPIIKDRIEITKNSKHILKFTTYLESGGGQNQFHYHAKISETFRVISGELNIMLGNDEMVLKAGESYSIPPFVNHYFLNKSDEQVIFEVKILNPKNIMSALQILYGLTNSGKTNKEGLPKNIFHTAIALNMMDAFSPKIPHILQKTGISTLARLGKVLGIEKRLVHRFCN